MAESYRCPQCGAEVPGDAPQGLCPNCVLKAGFGTQQTGGASQAGSESGSSASFDAQFVPPTPAELAPHFPDLEILELVGRGGMGVVYKARQKQLDRLVALKILLRKIGQDPAFAARFQREARAMAMLSHPHIVAVYDFGQTTASEERRAESGEGAPRSPHSPVEGPGEGGFGLPSPVLGRGAGGEGSLYYFLMEFVDGLNLRRLLDSGKLAPEEALAIVPQICDALQYAHDHGVVHRDIKPENVLLDKEGRVKIADFGIAKLVGREAQDFTLTGAGQVMGTPQYMAPEQIEHPLQVDHRADIYSLGVVFYQMLTGELPIGRFAPPSNKVQIDVRLDEVVLRALEKEPGRRYQQASEIKSRVETIATTPLSSATGGATTSPSGTGGQAARGAHTAEHDDAAIEQARYQVQGPAIGLLVLGILELLMLPLIFAVFVWPSMRVALVPLDMFCMLAMIVLALAAAVSSLTIVAAVKMKRLEAYGLAVAASILAIICGNLIGLAIGIWSLVVLSRPAVGQAFGRKRQMKPALRIPTGFQRTMGIAALVLCLAAIPVYLLEIRVVGGVLSIGGLLLFISIELVALILGVIGYRSRTGRDAAILSGLALLVLSALLIREMAGIHNDFRGWPGIERLSPSTGGLAAAAQAVFSPVIQRTVETDIHGKYAIDLDTGVLHTPPANLNDEQQLNHWIRAVGADAVAVLGSGLSGRDMLLCRVENICWDSDRPSADMSGVLSRMMPSSPGTEISAEMPGKGPLPVTYIFKTREGGMGLLQIVGFSENPTGVKIRYKLVREAGKGSVEISAEEEHQATRHDRDVAASNMNVDTKAAARAKLQSAEEYLNVIEGQYRAGTVTYERYAMAKRDRDVAAAELKGDAQAAARARLEAAEQILQITKARRDAGTVVTGLEYVEAKRDRDVAAAEMKGDKQATARARLEGAEEIFKIIEARHESGTVTGEEYYKAKLARDAAAAELAGNIEQTKRDKTGPPERQPIKRYDNPAKIVSAAAELKALLGLWKVVQCRARKDAGTSWPSYGAQTINPTKIDRVCFTPRFVEFACSQDGSSEMKDYHIDPTATPKTLDLFDQAHYDFDQSGRLLNPPSPERDRLIALGVYELEGGRLTIRLAEYMPSVKGDQRPKGIHVEADSEDLLLVLERYQPSDDEKAIQNDWAVISQVEDGKVVTEGKFRETRVRFPPERCGNEFIILGTVNADSGAYDKISSLYHGRFTLNPGSQPKSITLFNERMALESRVASVLPETLHGIYKFEGDRLMIAFRKGDRPPQKFESKPGSGITLLVLERPKPVAGPKPPEPTNGKSQAPSGATKSPTTADRKPEPIRPVP